MDENGRLTDAGVPPAPRINHAVILGDYIEPKANPEAAPGPP